MTDRTRPDSGRTTGGIVEMLQDRVAELEAQIEAIGAGGVGPLIGQPQAMPDLSALTERGAKAWAGVDAQGLREGADMSKEREAVARAIWALMREHEDRCDVELADLRKDHPIWSYADAARASLSASAGSEPVAWAWFAENGNIRVWTTAPREVQRLIAEEGLHLSPLYTHPSPPEGMAGMVPVAEVVECGTMGQQTLREIDGRWRWLSIGERLYAYADTGFAAPPLPASEAKEL